MEADDAQQPVGLQPLRRLLQQAIQHPQLIVHRDAQRLEGAGGGMNPAPTSLGGVATRHRIGQSRRTGVGALLRQIVLDPTGDAPRQPLLAVAIDQIGQLAFLQPVDQLLGRLPVARSIHAHIQGAVQPEAEAPFRHIQLRAADPQISHHHQGRFSRLVLRKIGGHDRDPISERGQALCRCLPGRGVLIQTDQPQPRMAFQQQSAMATTTEGGVDQHPLGGGELLRGREYRIRQHRHMAEGGHRRAGGTT